MSITGYIPGFPVKSYEGRHGDCQALSDSDGNTIAIDVGEPTLSNKLIAYLKNKKITNVTYILTHWHYDHDAGLKAMLEVKGICVDKIYCPPPSEIRYLQEDGHADDYNRANRRINLAKSLGKPIVYIPAGQYTDIQVGDIRCRLWRRASNKNDQNDREINNTSIQAYFPDLYYLTGGDMIDKDAFLRTKPGKVVMMKGYHHGNGDGGDDLRTIKGWGVKLYWYNNVEARGTAIGGSGFSKFGAGKAKGLIETVLRTDSDIVFTSGNKKLKVQKGASVWTFDVPYSGTGVAGWDNGEKGRWYQFEDGSYAVGWKQLAWSKGTDWFYFNENGIMCTGWYWDKDLKAWYYLDPATGAMQKGKPIHVDGSWYYMDGYGRLITGWHEPGDGFKRYLEPEVGKNQGHMYVNCTAEIDGKTWIFDGYGRATKLDTTAVTKVIRIAEAEVGYKEKASNKDLNSKTANAGSGNYTKYGRDMHNVYPKTMDFPAAWCDAFVDWCFYSAFGKDLAPKMLCGTFDDYTVNSANFYKKAGRWFTSPEIGDQIFFKNSGGICHTGIVYEIHDGNVYTIEGNKSNEVKYGVYSLKDSSIAGYGRPRWELVNGDIQPTKSIEEVAREVIAGKWGVGDVRKQLLAENGYDYATVQAKVNELLKH